MDKPTIIGEVYNILLNEQFKTLVLAGVQLAKLEVCTWNDLFEGSGLKRLGVSTNTLSSVLKALIDAGIVQKEKAPFPWRAKYRLVKKDPYLELLRKMVERIHDRHRRAQILKFPHPSPTLDLQARIEPDIEGLKEIGREAVEEWDAISKAAFLILLWLGFEGAYPKVSPFKVALTGFALLDYLFHATAHLNYEAREEAKRILMEQISGKELLTEEEMLQEPIIAKVRG